MPQSGRRPQHHSRRIRRVRRARAIGSFAVKDGLPIGGRLEALRRQARQAVRYRKLSGEIRQAEAMLAALHWDAATARLAEAEAELSAAGAAFAAASAKQAEAVKDEAIAARRLPDLRSASSPSLAGPRPPQ